MSEQDSRRDIVVIGASAGGIPPLLTVIERLPDDFGAAVLIVVHMPAMSKSRLPQLLQRVTNLPVAMAEDGEALEPGRIYVAPPDQHLLVRRGSVELSHGPRENHTRPAVDPLFRSAARAYGERVIGVVLSGTLYDGSGGLMAINAHRGVAIVQDPDEALMSGMPESAMLHATVDYVLPAAEIASRIVELVDGSVRPEGAPMRDDEAAIEQKIQFDFERQSQDVRPGESTMFTCPDCGGVLWQEGEGTSLQFRCHVGHAFAPETLVGLQSEEVEAALWTCVRMLKEKSTLSRQMATRYRNAAANSQYTERLAEQADRDDRYVEVLRSLLGQFPGPVGAIGGLEQASE